MQRYDLAFLKNDATGMAAEVALNRGRPGIEDWITDRVAWVQAYGGQFREARKTLTHAVELAQQVGKSQIAALYVTGGSLWEAFAGNTTEARKAAATALGMSQARDAVYGAAFALALSGDSTRMPTLIADLEKRFPEDTAVRTSYTPVLRALLALNRREPAKAVDALKMTTPYDLAMPPCSTPTFFGALYPVYVRGLAYLAARQGTEAAAEFQKVIDHRGIVVSDPIGALAYLQLGRAVAIIGDAARARTAYDTFFTLWKDADPELPVLIQARSEAARLK